MNQENKSQNRRTYEASIYSVKKSFRILSKGDNRGHGGIGQSLVGRTKDWPPASRIKAPGSVVPMIESWGVEF